MRFRLNLEQNLEINLDKFGDQRCYLVEFSQNLDEIQMKFRREMRQKFRQNLDKI